MNLVIAEKPSVARSIAAVIGATEKQNGYWQGGGYLVSWCIGHLVSFAEAGQYDEKYCKWKYEDLPILPQPWQFIVPDEKKQQFEIVRSLLNRPDVDSVTAATDAGREGELIFRFVYQMAGCTKPVKRLWISSMEDAAIREGFANLRPDSDYDALYQSALCRAKADWLVGINATRLFSVLYHKTLTVGRVQTPTLKMLVDRDAKILRFQKEKYYTVGIQSGSLKADSGRIASMDEANTLKATCAGTSAICTSIKRERKAEQPPIQSYHEYYTKDENWKNFVLHNKGTEAWEQDKAEREMILTEFIPYLKQHCNLSAMEQTATAALREGQNISPEQAAYYNTVVAYVQDCRPLLNQGQYNLPEPPKLADFDQSLQDYKAQVQSEIAQEAADAGMTVEEYAAAGFEAPQQDSFSIYQLRNEDSTRDYRFEPYDRLQAAGRTVDKANYMEVYAAPLTAGTTLEDIYRTFNIDHPADFKGHSLSVSDVVVLHQNGQDTAHYCDSVGFQQVPEFLRENPLRTAELSTEQNENMIDGVLNNASSLGELEAKAKAGEQISLTDLAAAVKAEEKAPKAKKSRAAKPKKPSIRAQLDAAKKEQSKQSPPREKTKELEV